MNLLPSIATITLNCDDAFFIRVKKLRHGWMYFQTGTSGRHISYQASYITDGLTNIADVAIALLDNYHKITSNAKAYEPLNRKYYIINHDLEGSSITWYLKIYQGRVLLLTWQDIDTDVLHNLHEAEFDSIRYEQLPTDIPPDLSNSLRFALLMPVEVFAQSTLNLLQDLKHKYTLTYYKQHWGFDYPAGALAQLQAMLHIQSGSTNS